MTFKYNTMEGCRMLCDRMRVMDDLMKFFEVGLCECDNDWSE